MCSDLRRSKFQASQDLTNGCSAARRAKAERLAFAVHAFLLAQGFRAVAVGSRAESADPGQSVPTTALFWMTAQHSGSPLGQPKATLSAS